MQLDNIKIRADGPYPTIQNAVASPQTVAILKNLNSSRMGELRAIFQYFYQYILSKQPSQDIAKIFEEIAIVEMLHSELLGEAIVAFGGDPVYSDSRGVFFNAGFVNYAQKLVDMLNDNIFLEQTAISDYTSAISMVENESLKQLFARIIEDEKLHLQIFKSLRASVKFFAI